jgi:hypothetical protein
MFAWLAKLFGHQRSLPAAVEQLSIPAAAPDHAKLPVVIEKPAERAKVVEAPPAITEPASETQAAETKPCEVLDAVFVETPEHIFTPEAREKSPEGVRAEPAFVDTLPTTATAEDENVMIEPAAEPEPEPVPEPPQFFSSPLPEPPESPSEEPSVVTLETTAVTVHEPPRRLEPDYQRQRSLYFAPARYGPTVVGSLRLLAPDLAYRAQQAMRPATPRIAAPDLAKSFATQPGRLPDAKFPLSRFIAASAPPAPATPGAVASLDPALFSAYVLHREHASEAPPEATGSYLTRPALVEGGRKLCDLVLSNWKDGRPPLTPSVYFALASSVNDHAGTAMLLCHNVAKAFARGGITIEWQNRNRARGVYWDGSCEYSASRVHRQGLTRANALSPPSMFYLLFSARSLGVADPGDWYRYFSYSTLAAYSVGSATYSETSWESNAWTNRLDRIADVLADSSTADSAGYRAWLWANTVHFAEWGAWGRRQNRALDTARMAIDAVRFAFARAQVAESGDWHWFVPAVGSLAAGNVGAESISQTLRASEVETR